jgi:putative transposase
MHNANEDTTNGRDDTLLPPTRYPWPHAPPHRLGGKGAYFVTCGTWLKQHRFRETGRRDFVCAALVETAAEFGWKLEAWAVFSNHYHLVARSPAEDEDAASLGEWQGKLHTITGEHANLRDGASGRKVWHNYRETWLTFEKSYFARLNYTHQNAVKHGLVSEAAKYPWCSAGWFERSCPAGHVKTIYSFKTDKLKIPDDYDVV